ncbi:MAG: hypothetical protein ABSD76_06385 [Terriglobales bacterium]
MDNASRLTNQMQAVIGFLEIDEPQPRRALEKAKEAIVTLHLISTAIAIHAAEADTLAADVHKLTAELTAKNHHRKPA